MEKIKNAEEPCGFYIFFARIFCTIVHKLCDTRPVQHLVETCFLRNLFGKNFAILLWCYGMDVANILTGHEL